jgi:putative component of membrane protein insertase Oxa1/YidC/SpoIIIJ protein YidD
VRYLLLLVIRSYWLLWPERLRRHCLFHESCSHHVFRITKAQGLISGLKALWKRFQTCRPGYSFFKYGGAVHILLVDGSVLPISEVGNFVLEEVTRLSSILLSDATEDGATRRSEVLKRTYPLRN